jgi:signal transduction histidine kinase
VIGHPSNIETGNFEFLGAVTDITERKRAEEALSSMAGKLVEAQEQKRRRIARELHDDINQRLASLAVSLDSVSQVLPSSAAEAKQEIEHATKQVEDLGIDVQALSHRLHSSKLDPLGLAQAAAGFCKELSDQQSVEVEFHCENIPKDLSNEISLCLFRVLQEALQNAAKYSGSRRFEVLLTGESNEIQLTVHDSGVGFNPDEAMKGRGLGLTSMRERLKLANGYLSIDSRPQRGTTILARVDLPEWPQEHYFAAYNSMAGKSKRT